MPFIAAELRWILSGPLPPTVSEWFATRAPRAIAEPPRTDLYLRLYRDDLGVKIRDGRLEVKGLLDSTGVIETAPGVHGEVQTWSKWWAPDPWLGAVPQEPGRPSEVAPGTEWVAVVKRRLVARFCAGPEGPALAPGPAPSSDDEPSGHVELCDLETGAGRYWTLAFEAPATDADEVGDEALLTIVRLIVTAGVPASLRAGNSLSYPAWLARSFAGRDI